MIDFNPLRDSKVSVAELTASLAKADLARLTDEMVDSMQALITGCVDADVTFEPEDPEAFDQFTDIEDEVNMPWTLGHLIVHVTASAEESAFLAAELARGVEYHGRSRYETPWDSVTTIEQCRQRLEDSRRMRLASLDMWPDPPHLDNTYVPWAAIGEVNAVARFVLGLKHDDDHLAQIADVVQQTRTASV